MKNKTDAETPHMVFVEGGRAPQKVHRSFKDAYEEAVRLAKKEPYIKVKVLQMVAQVKGEVTVTDEPCVVLPEDWGVFM